MRLAYIISAYKQPELLLRLVRQLDDEGATFMIHVDRRAEPGAFERVLDGCAGMPNVYFLARHRCRWGDFGHVRATLKGIAGLLERDVSFDHAILLTGQDYPIKSNERIRGFLARYRGRSFMAHFPLPTTEWTNGGLARIERWHVRLRGRHLALPIPRRVPGRLRVFGGSSYWCLTREAVEYVHGFTTSNARSVDFFKHVDVPDELFFQTILMNSPLAATVVDDDLRYIDWKDPDAGSPSVLGVDDFPELAASSKLFARKFDLEIDAEVLDRIDRELLGRDRDRAPIHG